MPPAGILPAAWARPGPAPGLQGTLEPASSSSATARRPSLSGTVTAAGKPVAGAQLDFWQAAANGKYWQQDPAQDPHNLRTISQASVTRIAAQLALRAQAGGPPLTAPSEKPTPVKSNSPGGAVLRTSALPLPA